MNAPRPPSLREELARALMLASLAWIAAVSLAIALGVRHEADHMMDAALEEAAEMLSGVLAVRAPDEAQHLARVSAPHDEGLVWQVVDAGGRVRLRSQHAPAQPLLARYAEGLSDTPGGWRVFATRLPQGGDALYVAQPAADRIETTSQAIAVVAASAAGVGLLFAVWLRRRTARALRPLHEISRQVQGYDPMRIETELPPATREEFVPIRESIHDLGRRLAARVQGERAFSAHAAHALRTPLAGMEAQLAVALKEAGEEARPRLERTRDAVRRLERVVTSLLALFRSTEALHVQAVDVGQLVAHLPVDVLEVIVAPGCRVRADANLLAGALANLLDNCHRHGARNCWITCSDEGTAQSLTVADDGPGVDDAQRAQLERQLDDAVGVESGGLGLKLAALVARAHRGHLVLGRAPTGGLSVTLRLWVDAAAPPSPTS